MKTISTKINPAFKAWQPLPILFEVPMRRAGRVASGASGLFPTQDAMRRVALDAGSCAMAASPDLKSPAVAAMN